MGTPEFAVASLSALVDSGANVVGVITATDKLGGRGGKQVLQSAVKKYAVANGLNVIQPKNLKGKRFLAKLRDLKADLQVVVAFRMLPKLVWDMPPLGTINVHGSLLPAYRGAAPIHWAVIAGEQKTGVTTFFLKHAIDTGDLLLQKELSIGENETTGEVYERLMHLGAQAAVESIELIASGQTDGVPQDDSKASHAPKIFHETAQIDWSASAKTCHNFIRGMSPFPCAWTLLDDKEMKIYSSRIAHKCVDVAPGILLPLKKEETSFGESPGIGISVANGEVIELLEVKLAGKRKQSGLDLRNGLRLDNPRPLLRGQ